MKILLLGKNGQVGWELQRALAPLGELISLDRHGLDAWSGDLSQPENVVKTILEIKPDIVVNASAYTAVDTAETDQVMADLVNHLAVKEIAAACVQIDALFIHYSTDYVFQGQGSRPFTEADPIQPINIYGQSKALGEQEIINSGCRFLIFRTSWVYAAKGKNFLKTMLMLAQSREELSVIDDQIGAPTSAELIADITAQIIPQMKQAVDKTGIYHLVASGETSWFGYADFIFKQAKHLGETLVVNQVHPIPTSAYPTPAKRPHNSRLNNQKIQNTFDLYLPNWQLGVKRTLVEILKK